MDPSVEDQNQSAKLALSWLREITLSVFIAVLIVLFLYQPVKVEGTSMMPSLVDQERIFINKFAYRFGVSEIRRGDTVVFLAPQDVGKSYIKRVIGVPGDKVEVRNGTVILNEKPIEEPYVPAEYRDHTSMPLTVVAPDSFFVLGDHRTSSNDSRVWGTVKRDAIYGKASFVYWPLSRIGAVR